MAGPLTRPRRFDDTILKMILAAAFAAVAYLTFTLERRNDELQKVLEREIRAEGRRAWDCSKFGTVSDAGPTAP